ncbi:hypothetical protein Nepgr_031306 [Nepenthes gracilis]|uniref:Uncharacterized protein n=1 Tax=Nepenthes gracilis TaxID=150966 RepID=A0AAD3TGA5_NEPGR|nr:hypothetical protein Nepgr_031306 [Nepenthes gracilis]
MVPGPPDAFTGRTKIASTAAREHRSYGSSARHCQLKHLKIQGMQRISIIRCPVFCCGSVWLCCPGADQFSSEVEHLRRCSADDEACLSIFLPMLVQGFIAIGMMEWLICVGSPGLCSRNI